MNSTIRYALEKAILAPSGENCQPWRFIVRDDMVELWNRPERDQSLYSWGQRASYMANGAALENFVLAASERGYTCQVQYFPSNDESHVATISLMEGGAEDPLASAIRNRISNRKPYAKAPLKSADRDALMKAVHDTDIELKFVESEQEKLILGDVGAVNEHVMLTNRRLHSFFFSHINWTAEQDRSNSIGFYIKTLELPPPAVLMFKLLSHWPIARVLAVAGMHRMVRSQNAGTNASASAIGVLSMQGIEPVDFVKAGRTLERIWLTATARRLSLQPLTGVLFFHLMIQYGDASVFSPAQRALITDAYTRAQNIFGGTPIVFMFRIGTAKTPSARSSRFPFAKSVEIRE